MGNFGGHALPGSFFIMFAILHIIQIYFKYYRSKQDNSKFVSSTWFPCGCSCGRLKNLPIEPMIKVVASALGGGLEIYTGIHHGVFELHNKQHSTMFFFFGLAGVFEILIFINASIFPPMLNYIGFLIAIAVEFILFRFHLHGRSDLNVLLHTLLLYILACLFITLLIETSKRDNVTVALMTRYLFLVQGTWFWQVGSILYKPISGIKWDQNNHEQMMTATIYFVWHLGVDLLIVILLGPVIACVVNRKHKKCDQDSWSMKRLITSNSNGQVAINDNSDNSDEDIEFQKAY